MTTKTAFSLLRRLISNESRAGIRMYSTEVSQTVLSKKIPMFHVRQIDPGGETAEYEVPKSIFYNELGLTARDLRFQHSHMLSARNCKVILRIQKLKAVVCSNALLLIDSVLPASRLSPALTVHDNISAEFLEQLPQILKENKLHTQNLPFEYRVLEAILSHNIEAMTAEIHDIEPKIQSLLETLTDPTNMDVDRSLVHILLQCNASLNKFSTLVKEFCQMLDDLLEYEDDLKELCISVEPNDYIMSSTLYNAYVFMPNVEDGEIEDDGNSKNHLRNLKASKPPGQYRINLLDEMEMLLDSFLKEGEELSNKVSELKQAIENSNSAILINLDSHRNMLLKLELQLTMGMFSCTYFGMLGMAFGMNLNSSLEENSMAFWVVTGIMFSGAGIAWLLLLRFLRKSPGDIRKAKDGRYPPHGWFVGSKQS